MRAARRAFAEELAEAVDGAASPEERQRIIVDAAVELSRALLDAGAPGLHLYCMNRSNTVLDIVADLGLRP